MSRWLAGLLLFASSLCALPAGAHPLAPSLLELRELDGGRVAMRFVTPALQPRGSALQPVLPTHCEPLGEPELRALGNALELRRVLDCGPRGLVGSSLGVSGLRDTRTNVIVRVSSADGREQRGVLHAELAAFEVQSDPGAASPFASYLRLGFAHILRGPDHLLFVAGLLLLAGGPRTLVLAVSAFTLGHSVTLAAAALGQARLPSAPLELAIAFSILWLASSLREARRARNAATLRRPGLMAAGFGLLHGFGFAGALGEVGWPAAELPLALAGFNLGIEVGQLLWVAALLAALWALGPVFRRLEPAVAAGASRGLAALWTRPRWLDTGFAYALGSLAAFWLFERLAAAL